MTSKSVVILGTRGYPSFYGGFETLVRRLAPYLVDAGWDVSVYGRAGTTSSDVAELDPRVTRIDSVGLDAKSLSTLSYGFTSSMDAARRKPDVALVMNVANGFWLPALKARGVRTVVNVDGLEWERDKWGPTAKKVFRIGARLTSRFADSIVCDSKAIGDYWSSVYSRAGTFIPYGGTFDYSDTVEPRFAPGSYALVVARFVPENSIDSLFEAVETIHDFDIVIVGSSGFGGEYDDRVKKLSQESANVHWLGHVSDDALLFSLWQHCGAYFHGHSVGGTNPALVQAMACGAPVIARDTPYNREVLGSGSEVFVQATAAEIADGLRWLVNNRGAQRSLGEQNRMRARQFYSWEGVCADYLGLLAQTRE